MDKVSWTFIKVYISKEKEKNLDAYLKKEAFLMDGLKFTKGKGVVYFINDCVALYNTVQGDIGLYESVILYGKAANLEDLVEDITTAVPSAGTGNIVQKA